MKCILSNYLKIPIAILVTCINLVNFKNLRKIRCYNAVAFFYLGESSSEACAPQMLDNLLRRSREIILANMRQLASPTLRILKSLYPRADLDAAGKASR
jgi:hypothetical protein